MDRSNVLYHQCNIDQRGFHWFHLNPTTHESCGAGCESVPTYVHREPLLKRTSLMIWQEAKQMRVWLLSIVLSAYPAVRSLLPQCVPWGVAASYSPWRLVCWLRSLTDLSDWKNKMKTSRILVAVCLLSVCAAQAQRPPAPVQGQQPTGETHQSDEIVQITTNLVQVDATVTGKDGRVVTNLKQEDFELFEDGKPQTITHFAYISNLQAGPNQTSRRPAEVYARTKEPRRIIALLIDDLGISFEGMAMLKHSLPRIFDQLQPNDLIAVIRTGGEVGALQQFTSERRLLENAFQHLRFNPCSRIGLFGMSRCGNGENSYPEDSLKMSLASIRFVLAGMRDLPGRKSVVIFSESLPRYIPEPGTLTNPSKELGGGELGKLKPLEKIKNAADLLRTSIPQFINPGSRPAMLEQIVELAIRNSVVIYSVDSGGVQYAGPTAADANPVVLETPDVAQTGKATNTLTATPDGGLHMPDTLRQSSSLRDNRAGGQEIARRTGGFMVVANDFGLERILNHQEGYYVLGYRPASRTFDRRFHRLSVRLKRSGVSVFTRKGFYGVGDEELKPKLTVLDEMDRALISPFGANDITVNLGTAFANDAAAGSVLRTFLSLDTKALSFRETQDGFHEANFDMSTVVFGDNGALLRRQDQKGTLRLKGPAYERARREGYVYSFDLPFSQPGMVQLRFVMRDQASGHIGTAGQVVEVPDLRIADLAMSGIIVRDERDIAAARDRSFDDSLIRDPAIRRFQRGATLNFAYEVYRGGQRPARQRQLTTQLRLFRDGKLIYEGSQRPLIFLGDDRRIRDNARLQIGRDFPPAQYLVEIVISDPTMTTKRKPTAQRVDFEVGQEN